ncbi:unnamed protein product [Clonostachys rosea]|uniref:2EXR domain-containing protein n=1 Tax=Bionectria ochroleuca TaxID=29856 RepID=A0ABY6V109_BIOOC|nr:unnamed protein product [Clonostachys rosea]
MRLDTKISRSETTAMQTVESTEVGELKRRHAAADVPATSDLKEFHFFGRLPPEIQQRVWCLALEDEWISPSWSKADFRHSAVFAISDTCRSAREHVAHINKLRVAWNKSDGQFPKHQAAFLPELDRDTLITSTSPAEQHTSHLRLESDDTAITRVGQTKKLIIYDGENKMFKHHMKIYLQKWRDLGSKGWRKFGFERRRPVVVGRSRRVGSKRSRKRPALKNHTTTLPLSTCDPFSFGTNEFAKISEHLGNLEDITLVSPSVHPSWRINKEYRVEGPEVMNKLPVEELIRTNQWESKFEDKGQQEESYQGKKYRKMLRYYQERGISDDTDIRWRDISLHHSTSDWWQEMSPWGSAMLNRPNIDPRGFSHNISSMGGIWAGFRLYLGDQPRLEFSPLHWDEVKEYMWSFQRFQGGGSYPIPTRAHGFVDETKHQAHFPEAIIKLFIVRPGQKPPLSSPHHRWEPLTGDFDTSGACGFDWRPAIDFNRLPNWKLHRLFSSNKALYSEYKQKEEYYHNRLKIRSLFAHVIKQLPYFEWLVHV